MSKKLFEDEFRSYIERCRLLDVPAVYKGLVYEIDSDNELVCIGYNLDGMSAEWLKKDSQISLQSGFYIHNELEDLVYFDVETISKQVGSFEVGTGNYYYVQCNGKFSGLKVFKTKNTITNIVKLELEDTEELADGCLKDSSVLNLIGNRVTKLGRNCFHNCSITNLSLLGLQKINKDVMRELRELRDIQGLSLSNNCKIIDDGLCDLTNGYDKIYTCLLNYKGIKRITASILNILLQNKDYAVILPDVEEISGLNARLTEMIETPVNLLKFTKLNHINSYTFKNIRMNDDSIGLWIHLTSVTRVDSLGFMSVHCTFLDLSNCETLSDDAFSYCNIKELYLTNMKEITSSNFRSCEIETLFVNQNTIVDLSDKLKYNIINVVRV